jgi:hydroxyethylthiazole kinase-like sugar kinase family protein
MSAVVKAVALLLPLVPYYIFVWALPNSIQIVGGFAKPAIVDKHETAPFVTWRPSLGWAVALGCLLAASIANFSNVQEFIYFQF